MPARCRHVRPMLTYRQDGADPIPHTAFFVIRPDSFRSVFVFPGCAGMTPHRACRQAGGYVAAPAAVPHGMVAGANHSFCVVMPTCRRHDDGVFRKNGPGRPVPEPAFPIFPERPVVSARFFPVVTGRNGFWQGLPAGACLPVHCAWCGVLSVRCKRERVRTACARQTAKACRGRAGDLGGGSPPAPAERFPFPPASPNYAADMSAGSSRPWACGSARPWVRTSPARRARG